MAEEKKKENKTILYIIAYSFEWLSGIIVYFLSKENSRLKKHAFQAIVLGVISFILSFISSLLLLPILSAVINVCIWFYGLYVGFKAYGGIDVEIPILTEALNNKEKPRVEEVKKELKSIKTSNQKEEGDALKALKLRYAKGEITKKKYNEMKKELE
jgi:uncharacterized membrane protein